MLPLHGGDALTRQACGIGQCQAEDFGWIESDAEETLVIQLKCDAAPRQHVNGFGAWVEFLKIPFVGGRGVGFGIGDHEKRPFRVVPWHSQ